MTRRLDGPPHVWHDRRRDGCRAQHQSSRWVCGIGATDDDARGRPWYLPHRERPGPRPFAQYLLREERSLLVDTGIVSTPDEVILPAFRELELDPADLDYVLISHADVDHFGGNAAIRAAAPRAIICAHVADCDWIGDRERILRERYGWYAAHGPDADYDADTKDWLRNALGSGRAGRSPPRWRRGVSSRSASLGRGSPSAGSLAGAHRTLGSCLPERDHHRCRVGRRAAQQRRRRHPSAALHAPRGVRGDRAPAATARAGATADRSLRCHGGRRRSTAFWSESLAFVARARSAIQEAIEASDEVTIAGSAGRVESGPRSLHLDGERAGVAPIRAHLQEFVTQ